MRCYLFLSIVLALLLAAWGTGCSGGWTSAVPHDQPASTQAQRDNGDKATGAPTLEPQPEGGTVTATPTPEATEVRLPAGAERVVGLAQEDLARRLDLAPDAIRVVSVEAVVWPDASLRCPKAGTVYGQVITPGFRVVLEAESQMYEYHTDREQTAVFCEEEVSAMEVPPVPGTVEPGLERLVNLVKEDLAQTLSIPVEEVEVLEAKSVVWPDASLGCPQPGMRYRQVPMDGARIRLAVEGRVYAYHSGGGRDPFLCEQPAKAVPGSDGALPLPGRADE